MLVIIKQILQGIETIRHSNSYLGLIYSLRIPNYVYSLLSNLKQLNSFLSLQMICKTFHGCQIFG